MGDPLYFVATSRSGLGHIRRVTNISGAVKHMRPETALHLITNAPIAGLSTSERELFDSTSIIHRSEMSNHLAHCPPGPVVVDTAIVTGLSTRQAPLALILRETRVEHLASFRLEGSRPWDLILIPNPSEHWTISNDTIPTRDMRNVGWIYRRAPKNGRDLTSPLPLVLLANGGGGSAGEYRNIVTQLLNEIGGRHRCRVIQIVGPRSPKKVVMPEADELVHAPNDVHEWFNRVDVVITTAGYNTVLELATTDTPALLIAADRTHDDQAKRARLWGPRLGHCYDEVQVEDSIRWLDDILNSRRRRHLVDLGPCGAELAAECILGLLK